MVSYLGIIFQGKEKAECDWDWVSCSALVFLRFDVSDEVPVDVDDLVFLSCAGYFFGLLDFNSFDEGSDNFRCEFLNVGVLAYLG